MARLLLRQVHKHRDGFRSVTAKGGHHDVVHSNHVESLRDWGNDFRRCRWFTIIGCTIVNAHSALPSTETPVRRHRSYARNRHASTQVDVIIRTLANRERKAQLERAIASVLEQESVAVRLHVVVNGDRYSREVLTELRNRSDLTVHYMSRASAGAARMLGRKHVKAPFFLFLDDDDELMPHALSVSLLPMMADPEVAAVITNGYHISADGRRIFIPDLAAAQPDPLTALLQRAWMASCGALFNTAFIGPELFEPEDLSYHEWTLLAFRIALSGIKIRFLDLPTYNIYDTAGSASKTVEYAEGQLRVVDIMRSYRVPRRARKFLEKKYRNLLHVLAEVHRNSGNPSTAWRFHVRSMKPPYTLQYLLFTRKLLRLRAKPTIYPLST